MKKIVIHNYHHRNTDEKRPETVSGDNWTITACELYSTSGPPIIKLRCLTRNSIVSQLTNLII